jgi:hypothetical protein
MVGKGRVAGGERSATLRFRLYMIVCNIQDAWWKENVSDRGYGKYPKMRQKHQIRILNFI